MAFRRSVAVVASKALSDALLAALSARPAAALLTAPNVHLYVNNVEVANDTVVGDLDEAAFAGYAAPVMGALLGPVRLDNGDEALHVEADFVAGAVVAPGEVAYGYFVTDTTNAIFYFGEKFAEPVTFSRPGDFLSLDIIFPEPAARSAD